MSNENSVSQRSPEIGAVRIIKLTSGDEIVGTINLMPAGPHLIIDYPAKLLLTGTPEGMGHFLSPFSFDMANPRIAVDMTAIVYVMRPAPAIMEAYHQQVRASRRYAAFAAQPEDQKAAAADAARQLRSSPMTLH